MQICYHRVLASWTRHFFGYIAAILLVSTMSLGLLPATQTRALTTTPTKMNFQGRLTDSSGTTMPDGLYNMKFRLFTVASGGSDVWNETRETTNRVQVTNGLFSVQLGAVTPISASLFASGSLYFEVELPTPATATCGTGSCQTWTEGPMTTRSILSTSAYAFNSETLDGLDSTGFIQNQDSSVQTAAKLWIGGTARVDTSILAPLLDTATATTLEIGTTNATSISLKKDTTLAAGKSLTLIGGVYGTRPASPTAGMLYYDTTSNQLLQYNGTKWVSDRSTATKIVAASNASQALKDGADYVVSGNAEDEINAALTAAAGGKVYLTEGTYTVGASISIPNNTTLAGAGNGTIITIPNSFNAAISVIANTDTTTGIGVVIRDLRIDGNKANQTAGVQTGINLNTVTDSTVTDVVVQNMRTNGVYVTDYSYSVKISNNIIANNESTGLFLDQYTYYATVTGNVMRGNGWVGMYALRFESSVVSGNSFESNTTNGIYVESSTDNTFSANTIGDNGDSGFLLTSSSSTTVSNNALHDNGGSANNNAIYLNASDNTTITGNNISDGNPTTTNYAINISNSTSDKNYLADNRFSSAPGTATINDAGTGTTFANQPMAENGMNLLNRSLNSTTAFSIQGTNKVNVLNVDTTNGELELGNYNSGTNAVNGKLVMGNSTNANLVSLVSGATGTSYTLTLPTAVGASGDCLKTSDASGTLTFGACAAGGGVTSVGAFSGSSIANGASIAGTVITFGPADASNPGMVTTGAQTIAGVKTFNDSLILATAKTISMTGGDTATRPGSPTEGMIYYDTDTDRLITYSNGKWQTDRTDAVLVAASNSSQADKDAADYVADGTDDQVQINAALTAADPASGTRKTGKVFLFAGTYTTHRTDNSDATIFVPNNTTLAGAGRGTLIRLGDIDVTDNLIENTDQATGTGVVIRDLRLDGQDTANTAGTQYGIFMVNMGSFGGSAARQGTKINNVWVNDFRSSGMYFNVLANSQLIGNIAQGSSVGYGFLIGSSTHNTITNNEARGNALAGFNLSGGYTSITGNISQYNAYGFTTSGISNSTISQNIISVNGTAGINLSASTRNTISNNSVTGSGGTDSNNAIYLTSSSTSNNIVDNVIGDDSAGITNYAINISDSSSSSNYLSNNTFVTTPANATINDVGTGTVYANQPRAENGGQLTNRTADNATAFTIQNASGVNVLTADTSAGEIELGAAALAGKLVISDGANSTVTLSLNTITGDNNYTLGIPAITGSDTFCLQSLGNCGLKKDALDTSSAAVGAASYLYGFTNSSSAVASGVLQLNNGTNTGNTLRVTASGNPGSGNALIFASNTNASPTGNLIDLQSGSSPTSKFSVTAGGNVAFSGNVTAGAWNGTAVTGAYGGTGHNTTAVGDLLIGAAGNTWNKLTIGGNGTCLKSNGTTAAWDTCGGGGDLSTSYAADADGGDAIIALTTADGGIRIQDAATPLATAFSVEENGGTATYFSVSSTGIAMNDSASRPTLLMQNSSHQLRVYEDVASSPRYAVMYYDTANNMAVFGASSGATQIGTSGAGGDINLSLSGAAADKLTASKTFNLASAYSGNDFTFKRNLTGTSYAMTGNVMVVEDASGFTGGSSSPNLLYINQGNTGATGNLILSQTGGSVDKFKVDVSGNVTAAGTVTASSTVTGTSFTATTGGVSIASGASYTGAGAVTVSSASGTNLTLLAQGAGKVIAKPGTDSASSFEVQDSAGASMLLADSTNDRIVVGVSDTVGTTFVLDTKTDTGDPTGVDGAMYYNSDAKAFRCYKNGLWVDCNFSSLRSEWVLQEDFLDAGVATATIGTYEWTLTDTSTSTEAKVNASTDASNRDRWGIYQTTTAATAGGGNMLRLDPNGMAGTPANMTVEFDHAPSNAAAADGTQTAIRIGLMNGTTTSADPTDGIYFQYSTTTAAGNWFMCAQNNNAVTCTDTGVARTTTLNVYQRFKFVTNSSGTSVEFFINETSVGTVTTNLPANTRAIGPAIGMHTVNATARAWKIDYFQIKRNLSTLR